MKSSKQSERAWYPFEAFQKGEGRAFLPACFFMFAYSGWYSILAALLANVLAQVLKVLLVFVQKKKFEPQMLLACGGFPSSHTSTVSALAIAVGHQQGFRTPLFAVTVIFASIVMYDACNVRWYSGRNIEVTAQLVRDLKMSGVLCGDSPLYEEKLKMILGHRKAEVLGGLLLGVLVAQSLWLAFF